MTDPGRELEREIAELHVASFAWARACVGDDGEAEDVLQTTYEKIFSGRARSEGRASLKTWLFGVIRLTALEHRRRAWLRWLRFSPLTHEPEATTQAPNDASETIRRALAVLPERQRQVVHLVFYEDLTVDEAAACLAISVGSARVHYDRGKKRLRELLTESGVERGAGEPAGGTR